MSALGQSRHFDDVRAMSAMGHFLPIPNVRAMSAIPPKASKITDIAGPRAGAYAVWCDVGFSGR
jgi:hypothetical protein